MFNMPKNLVISLLLCKITLNATTFKDSIKKCDCTKYQKLADLEFKKIKALEEKNRIRTNRLNPREPEELTMKPSVSVRKRFYWRLKNNKTSTTVIKNSRKRQTRRRTFFFSRLSKIDACYR